MDIISEQTYTEETVTDYEFAFSGGEPLLLTLKEGDSYINGLVTMANPAGTIHILPQLMLWMSKRTRVIKRAKTLPPRPDSTDANLSLGR